MAKQSAMAVYEIFKSAFGNDVWAENIFRKIFETCKTIVIDDGALIYRDVMGQTEILNVAVKPNKQNKGLGSELIKTMFMETPKTRVYFLEVSVKNISAIKLYEKNNFVITGKRENYYSLENGEKVDAYTMEYRL